MSSDAIIVGLKPSGRYQPAFLSKSVLTKDFEEEELWKIHHSDTLKFPLLLARYKMMTIIHNSIDF